MMTVNISEPVPLSASVSKRFYEAVIFLYCLIAVNFKNKTTKTPDLETTSGKSPKDEFFCFVNKLGQICDSQRGGDTITAFAILQPGSIEYRFASNNRDQQSLDKVKAYITDIITTLGQTPDAGLGEAFQQILGMVLAFNRPRIGIYITAMNMEFEFCIMSCEKDGTTEAKSAAEELVNLRKLAEAAAQASASNKSFTVTSQKLFAAINDLYASPFDDFTRIKARQDQDPENRTPWAKLRHSLGRLQSYNIAVKVLITLRRRRQELFEDFEVVPIPSSGPGHTPNVRRCADGIARRMNSLHETPAYKNHAPYLKQIGLDDAIKKAAKPTEFQPIVHAEINLLDSILSDEQTYGESLRFFGESNWGKYIGCSKPTCRLCQLYFSAHPSDVQVRLSHQNVYYKWRPPNVYEHQGTKVKDRREKILEKMIDTVRTVTERTISDQVAQRKTHDSFTTPSNPLRSTLFTGSVTRDSVDDLVSSFGGMDLRSVRELLDDDVGEEEGNSSLETERD
ncbi:hypothetical protein B0H66DRAFT_383629 [Apodospora peruviana]|uniref:Uncharacterized protein n=1 Tax=Apodospora peruviana TaxID=516989 RepID=A0AAE0HU55_9PEZI|nr:hypothetical protein B0H66DRAFT_383629 [Apodospora peruviana]